MKIVPANTRRRVFLTIGYVLWLICSLGCDGDSFNDVRNLGSTREAIVCLGDSLTEGVGANPGEDYPSVLSRELAFPVANLGRRGDTTAQALARLPEVLERTPRLVIVLLGGNDFLRQVPRSETRRNLAEVVDFYLEALRTLFQLPEPSPESFDETKEKENGDAGV